MEWIQNKLELHHQHTSCTKRPSVICKGKCKLKIIGGVRALPYGIATTFHLSPLKKLIFLTLK